MVRVVGATSGTVGVVASNVIVRSFAQMYCPAPLLGRLTATMSTLAYGAIPLGGPIRQHRELPATDSSLLAPAEPRRNG